MPEVTSPVAVLVEGTVKAAILDHLTLVSFLSRSRKAFLAGIANEAMALDAALSAEPYVADISTIVLAVSWPFLAEAACSGPFVAATYDVQWPLTMIGASANAGAAS